MQINYINKKVKERFSPEFSNKWDYPDNIKEKMLALENAMVEAENLYDISCLPQYRFHRLEGKRKDEWSLSVGRKYRVTLIPCDEQGKYIKEGDILAKCKNITIVEITEVSNHYE